MPLSESEELELLELENEEALAMQGKDPYGRPIAKDESIREEYPSEKFAKYAEPVSQFAGAFAKTPFIGTGLAALGTASVEAARQGIQAYGNEPGRPKTSDEAARRIVMAGGRGALGEGGARGIFGAASAVGKAALPTMQKTGAQVVRVATGVPEREALAVIKDPAMLGRAKTVKQAGQQYEDALAQSSSVKLQSGGPGSRVAFGKTMLSPEATINKYDELLPIMEKGELDLQSALSLRQTASSHLAKSKGDWYDQPLREAVEEADKYIEKRLLEFPAAKTAYREAKVGEEFGSWLPLNKNLSPNVLRTAGALGYAAHGAAEGRIGPMLMALGVSPKIWGYGIRAASAGASGIQGAAKLGTRLGTQEAASSYFPSSTDELMQKYYERQK